MEKTLLNELNMKINAKKTKVLVRSRSNNIKARIHLQGNRAIEQMKEFPYLESITREDGRIKE